MKKTENISQEPVNHDKTNFKNVRRIILKLVFGFGIIAVLVFFAVNIVQKKLFQLSETVSIILKPNTKLIKLKEISGCIYGAEADVKAFAIGSNKVYLLNYENHIAELNLKLDTLLWLSTKGEIVDMNQAKANQIFSSQVDTLRGLIVVRVNLFNDYIKIKTGDNSQDALVQLLQKIQIKTPVLVDNSKQKIETPKKSYFSQLFSSKKNKKDVSKVELTEVSHDLTNENIQKIIAQTLLEEKINEGEELSKEIDITQRENRIMNHISSLLNNMEEKELAERIKIMQTATKETTAQISFISNWITVLGLILALLFSYFIYRDILKAKRFKEQLLLAKLDLEKSLSQYTLSLIEASLNPLVTINSNGKIMDMNQATVKITGLSRENLIGTDFLDYFTEPQKAREIYQEIFAKGSVSDAPLTLRHNDGNLIEVLYNGAVYKDETGNVLGVVVVARDITNQKIFENELIEAKNIAEKAMRKAKEATELVEAFLANMSHEIRTPMNAIMGFADLLSERKLGVKETEYVSIIKSAGENLLAIINDILDISKIEAGMMTFEENNFSIKQTFKSLYVMLMGKATEKNIELLFTCDKNVPEVLLGDHTRFTQIIINLVNNALKFTQNGSVHVHAKLLKSVDGITFMEFSITDTGIGIPKDKLNLIFDRFRQAESDTTRKYGGSGLGLSIAKQLVELQNGTLSVESELKVGSVFTFSIPYKKSSQTQIESEIIVKNYNMEDLNKLNILLVEDNLLNIKLISSLFEENNLKIQIAENGSEGVKKVKENNFDIILMDMEMPVMNGYDATTMIRKKMKNNIPIIAMTAHAMSGERERCLSFGMNDYISKPINAILLFEKMYDLTHKL